MNKKILATILSLILLLSLATPAFAQGPDGAQFVFGDNVVVKAEETLNRDLVVFGGNITIERLGRVEGDIIVFGGNVQLDGTVAGDIGLIGGNIDLGETAVAEGDIGLIGSIPAVAKGAVIKGEIKSLTNFEYDYDHSQADDDGGWAEPPGPPEPPAPPWSHPYSSWGDRGMFGWFGRIMADIVQTTSTLIILSLITWPVATFMPEQMANVRETVFKSMPLSFGLGLITLVVAIVVVPLALLLLVTICLALIPVAVYTLLGVAMLFGWIVIGQIIGERLLAASGRPHASFTLSSLVGVLALTLIAKMPVIGATPCLGFLLGLIGSIIGLGAALTGLGAVLLTRFGARPYPAPASFFSGSGGPGSASFRTGPRVRWTDEPEVSEEERASSEAELKARIKAALAEADRADQPDESEPAGPGAGEKPDQEQPERNRTPGPKPESGEDPEM